MPYPHLSTLVKLGLGFSVGYCAAAVTAGPESSTFARSEEAEKEEMVGGDASAISPYLVVVSGTRDRCNGH